jgi:hypothetical protein
MEALCIRHDNGKKHVYHRLVKRAILRFLDISPRADHINGVGLECSRPAIPRRPAQALHLARSSGRECWWDMNLFNPHHRPAAQAEMVRAFDSRPVSCQAVKRCLTPDGGEKCLAQTECSPRVPYVGNRGSAIPWSSGQCPFHCVGRLSKRSSQFTRRSRKHWKCDGPHTRSISSARSSASSMRSRCGEQVRRRSDASWCDEYFRSCVRGNAGSP